MKTALCAMLGIETPIVQAPMGGATSPALAAAVSNAGGLGGMPLWGGGVDYLRDGLAAVRALTERPFVVNINTAFPHMELIDACLELEVPLVSLFWGASPQAIERAGSRGARVMVTVGGAREAAEAVAAGAGILVAQGWEAGGHVRGDVATMALVPAVVDAARGVPVVAAGGIADGRGMAAALALGAAGVWIGTRFLASEEAAIHAHYQRRLLDAAAGDAVWTEDLYHLGWPGAAHRTLKNATWRAWVDAGRPAPGGRPGEGERIVSGPAGEIERYTWNAPEPGETGDLDALAMYAGQGVGLVREVMPAARIVEEITRDADAILRRLAKGL